MIIKGKEPVRKLLASVLEAVQKDTTNTEHVNRLEQMKQDIQDDKADILDTHVSAFTTSNHLANKVAGYLKDKHNVMYGILLQLLDDYTEIQVMIKEDENDTDRSA